MKRKKEQRPLEVLMLLKSKNLKLNHLKRAKVKKVNKKKKEQKIKKTPIQKVSGIRSKIATPSREIISL